MKVSDYISHFLHAQGVPTVFEVVGGMITHLLDSVHRHGKIRVVSMHHEQAASFAADAMGRMTGIPGVAMATSGPGATNLLTGIGSCYFDSSPAVFITGQVNRNEQKRNLAIRQLGFQETDIVAMAAPITKAAWRVESPEEIPFVMREAFRIALSGRPGPVLVDIPMDVQRAQVDAGTITRADVSEGEDVDEQLLQRMLRDLSAAERPLILAGGGIRAAGAIEPFRALVNQLGIPVVNSLLAVDVLPFDHPLRGGMIGSYGNRWNNLALGQSDFILVLGSRLDIRQTGSDTDAFKSSRVLYHVDMEAGEINNRVKGCQPVLTHLQPFFRGASRLASGRVFPDRSIWLEKINSLRRDWPDTAESKDVRGINPNVFMHALSQASGRAAAFTVDVGQHQMWAAQSLELQSHQRFLTSGGMGAMGFALPAALGAAFAKPTTPVVMIAGDGGFQLNLQELQTIVRNRLPIKMVVLNNQCHGMVRQFQQSYFDEQYQSTYWGYSAPDFARVASAYGIAASTVQSPADLAAALELMWQDPAEPFLLQVMIDTFANAYPKIAFGHPLTEMEPLAKPIGMEST